MHQIGAAGRAEALHPCGWGLIGFTAWCMLGLSAEGWRDDKRRD